MFFVMLSFVCIYFFFFFKQKTAYEMRISDWSSDVCSSDLLGSVALANRIVMSPLTRNRASEGRIPNDLMRTYYFQRATAGLILSEATSVSPQGVGYPSTPGIWSSAQVEGWKKITQTVHNRGEIGRAHV